MALTKLTSVDKSVAKKLLVPVDAALAVHTADIETNTNSITDNTNNIVTNANDITALQAGQTGGVIVFATYALLDAYTPATAQESASFKVTDDSNTSLNGYYSWVSGTTYTKDADLVVNTIDANNTSDAVSGRAVFDYVSYTVGNAFDISTVKFNKSLPTNGTFPTNSTRDVSDFINLNGATEITIGTNDGKLVSAGIAFYSTLDGSPTTIGNYNDYLSSFTATVPAGAVYAVLVLRRDVNGSTGTFLPYYGDSCFAGTDVPNYYVRDEEFEQYKVTVDASLESRVKKPSVFNSSTVRLNSQPPNNGVFPTDLLRDASNFIDLNGATEITVTTSDSKLVCGAITFYNTLGGTGTTIGSFSDYLPSVTATVPAGALYAVLLLRRDVNGSTGSFLPYYGDTCFAITDTPTAADNQFLGKSLSIFTSSNGDPAYGTWPIDLAADTEMILNNSAALAGATYPLLSAGGNSIVTGVETYIAAYTDPVDLIMFNAGSNSAGTAGIILGDFDIVVTKTLAEIRGSTDVNFGINTFYGSMRWCFETMQTEQPNATIMIMTTFQFYEPYNTVFFNTFYEPIKKMASWVGCPLIDCYADGSFNSSFEPQGQVGRHTQDGIHTKKNGVINNAGRLVQRRFLKQQILTKYYIFND